MPSSNSLLNTQSGKSGGRIMNRFDNLIFKLFPSIPIEKIRKTIENQFGKEDDKVKQFLNRRFYLIHENNTFAGLERYEPFGLVDQLVRAYIEQTGDSSNLEKLRKSAYQALEESGIMQKVVDFAHHHRAKLLILEAFQNVTEILKLKGTPLVFFIGKEHYENKSGCYENSYDYTFIFNERTKKLVGSYNLVEETGYAFRLNGKLIAEDGEDYFFKIAEEVFNERKIGFPSNIKESANILLKAESYEGGWGYQCEYMFTFDKETGELVLTEYCKDGDTGTEGEDEKRFKLF